MKIIKNNRINNIFSGILVLVMALSLIVAPSYVKAANVSDDVSIDSEIDQVELQKISGISAMSGKIVQTVNNLTTPLGSKTTTVKDRNWRLYCSQNVFDQMDDKEKKLYNNLENVCMSFAKYSSEDATYKKYKDENGNDASGYFLAPAEYSGLEIYQVQDVIQLFIYQNPQYYFTTISLPCLYTSKEVYLPCYEAFADGEERASITNKLFEEIDSIVADIQTAVKSNETGSYDIERAAHDYLCEELSYEDAEFSQSIYSAFTSKKTVCLGYSLTFELLMNAAGVSTVTAYSDMHAWNKVLVGGDWYAVDVTWDDQEWGIADDWFNKSDISICFDDSELNEHTMKVPKYFPNALYDYVVAHSDSETKKTDSTVVKEITSTVANNTNASSIKPNAVIIDDNKDVSTASDVEEVDSTVVNVVSVSDKDSKTGNEIIISGSKLSKVKAGAKKCTITWKKTKNIDGYEIQLSTSKKFKKIAKKVKVSSSKTSTTVKKLKKKTTYYVRIRTYKKVNGKMQTSSWSGVKKVTVK